MTLIDRGVEEARLLRSDPANQADLLMSLASVNQKLGRFDRADSLLNEALEAQHRASSVDSAARATLWLTRGDLRIDQARFAEADSALQNAMSLSATAPALLKARVGDEVALPTPAGVRMLEVLEVSYPQPDDKS